MQLTPHPYQRTHGFADRKRRIVGEFQQRLCAALQVGGTPAGNGHGEGAVVQQVVDGRSHRLLALDCQQGTIGP